MLLFVLAALLAPAPLPPGAVQRLGDPTYRHGKDIAASVLSPCGRLLATAGPATIAVTDVATGRRVRTFPSFGAVKRNSDGDDVGLTFSPTGRRLAVRLSEGVWVWNLATGNPDWRADKGRRIGHCRFGATDDEFVTVRIPWPQKQRPLVAERDTWSLATSERLDRRACDLIWAETPDGARFARRSGALVEWGTDAEVRVTGDVRWSPDGSRLCRLEGGTVELFARGGPGSVVTVELPRTFRPFEKDVVIWPVRFGFSEDARELWVIRTNYPGNAGDRQVYRWAAATGAPLPPLAGHIEVTKRVHFPPGGKTIVTVGREGVIKTWGRVTGKPLWPGAELGHSVKVGFSADGSTFAAAPRDVFHRYDTRTGERQSSFTQGEIGISTWVLGPDGNTLLKRKGNRAAVLDARTGREIRTVGEARDASPYWREMKPSADGSRLLIPDSAEQKVVVWDVPTGEWVATVLGMTEPAFTPDGRTVLGRKGFTAAVEAWDIAAGKRSTLFDLAGPQPDGADGGAYHALTLTPDGRRLAAADTCGPVVVHDMKTGRLIARLPVFPFSYPAVGIDPDRAYVLAFSPDGRFLAASTSIHTIDVWDVEKRTRVARFAGHDATPWHLQFDPSGNGVWSASDDGIAYRWDLSEVVRGLKK